MNEAAMGALGRAIRGEKGEVEKWLTSETLGNLWVYQRNHLAPRLAALMDCYPVGLRLLGPSNFRYFGRDYIENGGDNAAFLNHFGCDFPAFMMANAQIQATQPRLGYFLWVDYFHHHPLAPHRLRLDLPRGIVAVYGQYFETGVLNFDDLGPCCAQILTRG